MRKFKFGFDPIGLILFFIIMIPNIFWMIKPAPNDILRGESLTPVLDGILSISQILFVGAMCGIVHKEKRKFRFSAWMTGTVLSAAVYYLAWGFYYSGNSCIAVVILLTVSLCMAFIAYLIHSGNSIALLPAILFSLCHLFHSVLNFIV